MVDTIIMSVMLIGGLIISIGETVLKVEWFDEDEWRIFTFIFVLGTFVSALACVFDDQVLNRIGYEIAFALWLSSAIRSANRVTQTKKR